MATFFLGGPSQKLELVDLTCFMLALGFVHASLAQHRVPSLLDWL